MSIELFNCDSYKYIKSIENKSIDLVLIDPPYEIKGVHDSKFGGRELNSFKKISDYSLDKGFDFSIFNEFLRVLKHINIFIWCNKSMIYSILTFFSNFNCNYEIFIWAKTNPLPFCNNHFLSDKEYCLYFYDNNVKPKTTYDLAKTFYQTPLNLCDAEDYAHPCVKPLYIIENLIKVSTSKGDTVLDAFVGSGTTALACKHLDRNFIGCEINKNFYEIAINRLNGINAKGELNLFDI